MNKLKLKISKLDATKFMLSIIFIALVFIPLVRMFSNMNADNLRTVLASEGFSIALKNSLVATMVATIITITLAMIVAFSVARTKIKYKAFFVILFTLPMLIPSISIGMGLTILFGNNGILTNIFGMKSGAYGFVGIVMGSILYAFPVAFTMVLDILKYEDGLPYEAAKVLGLSKYEQFKVITLPYMRKPLINVIFAIFTLIITDYGVPLMIGGKYSTLPVIMYQEVIGQLNFGKGSVYGTVLLIPAVIAFVIDLANNDRGNSAYVIKEYNISNSLKGKITAYVICILCGGYTLLPILSFVLLAFTKNYPQELSWTLQNVVKTMNLKADTYLLNSVIIALMVAAIGVVVAFLTAYLSARTESKVSRFLHLSSMTSAAIPGIVLGLSYVLTFKKTAIYGTIIILIMVNLVHFISSPYLMIYNSLNKLNGNLENVGQTLGIGRVRLIVDVFIPTCRNTLFEMFSYFFVNCMMTISAVSFLANTSNKPVALMINQFEAQMQLEYAAVVSLMILCVNITIKVLFGSLKKRLI